MVSVQERVKKSPQVRKKGETFHYNTARSNYWKKVKQLSYLSNNRL